MLNKDMQDIVDAGPLCPVLTSHSHAWWLGDAAPQHREILNSDTLSDIMAHYYEDEEKYAASVCQHACPLATNWTCYAITLKGVTIYVT
jgi:hypothetical protein